MQPLDRIQRAGQVERWGFARLIPVGGDPRPWRAGRCGPPPRCLNPCSGGMQPLKRPPVRSGASGNWVNTLPSRGRPSAVHARYRRPRGRVSCHDLLGATPPLPLLFFQSASNRGCRPCVAPASQDGPGGSRRVRGPAAGATRGPVPRPPRPRSAPGRPRRWRPRPRGARSSSFGEPGTRTSWTNWSCSRSGGTTTRLTPPRGR